MTSLVAVPPTAVPSTPAARISAVVQALCATFPERETLVADLYTAAVAGEHVVVVGPPGTAKSALVRAFAGTLDATYFEYLLSPYTEPNEIYGSLDMEAFKSGVYRRVVDGLLPTAQIAFLDEAFKANSAILNSMLALLNERLYHNGGTAMAVPLQTAVLASNELPQHENNPFWDRCLVRHVVLPLQHNHNRLAMLSGALPAAPAAGLATMQDVQDLRETAASLPVSQALVAQLIEVFTKLASQGIVVSDRRQVQCIGYLRAVAALDGADEVSEEHTERLGNVLWNTPAQQQVVEKVLSPLASAWKGHLRSAKQSADLLRATLAALEEKGERADLVEVSRVLRGGQTTLRTLQAGTTKQAKNPDVQACVASLNDICTRCRQLSGVVA